MLKKKHGDLFWLVLGMFNLLVVCYALNLCLKAGDDLERLLATFVMIGTGLLLVIVDTVSIVIAHSK
jgi:hypothetical protein